MVNKRAAWRGQVDSEEDRLWTKKGATLSDKSAQKEFGLTQEEITQAIKDGKLRYRLNNIHGNPYLRLIRREVETLVTEKHGRMYLEKKKLKKELAQINRTLKALKTQVMALEKRRVELLEALGE
jgi:hypothetical protein